MRESVRAALQEIAEARGRFEVRRHRVEEFAARGEYSSNIAFLLAKTSRKAPPVVAEQIKNRFFLPGIDCVSSDRGFLNFRMNDETLLNRASRAVLEGERYGAGESLAGQRINMEFVSADPTGPLHLVHGRIAVAGEALCRVLEFQGAAVTREYFLNDVEDSSKMRLLGESVAAQYSRIFGHEEERPEGVLEDIFVRHVAEEIAQRDGNRFLLHPENERVTLFAHAALEAAVEDQKKTLKTLGIPFDVWSSESTLIADGRIDAVVSRLQDAGHIEEKNGVLWLKTSTFGDETDRPLRRANGQYTYLASDIAYHIARFERGYDRLINIWTAEHAPYPPRTRAGLLAAGYPAERLEVLICATTRFLRDNSLFDGDFLLDDALKTIDAESLRFLLLLPEWQEAAQIEIEMASRDDESNPAYAARLLPSRLSTLLQQAQAQEGSANNAKPFATQAERSLASLVALWPEEAALAASELRPQRVAEFVLEMADATRQLLTDLRPDNTPSVKLLSAAHRTAGVALRLLGMQPKDNF